MKIKVSRLAEPVQVYAISWLRYPLDLEDKRLPVIYTFFDYEDDCLRDVYEGECGVVDGEIDDFLVVPIDYEGAPLIFMWRPLAEAGIWVDLREFYPEAVSKFRELRLHYIRSR